MDRLQPLQRLEDDYYVGEIGRPAVESDYDSSSDDELQHELKRLAGIPNCKEVKKEKERDEFVDEMESDLDDSISEYARKHMGGSNQDLTKDELPQLVDPTTDNEMETSLPGTSKDTKSTPASKDTKSPKKQKKVTINEDVEMGDAKDGDETNPILKMAKAQLKEKEEKPDFYDSDEDEDNERWIAEKRRQSKGMKKDEQGNSSASGKESRAKIDDESDAVLSCPGCMSLLTRDCQRHEIYKNQYRAMFVENVEVVDELMTVEETGKTKRNKRRKEKKSGVEHQFGDRDLFYPVRCVVCKTSVGVVDLEEVYHFFNVLSGYA